MLTTHESDLFFNMDHDDAKIYQGDVFIEYDPDQLREQAEDFCEAIEAIGGRVLTPDDVLTDFYQRL